MRTALGLCMAVSLAVPGLGTPSAGAAGIPAKGKQIAERACASCHLVGPAQTSAAAAGAPSFTAIAEKYGSDVQILAGFLADPHPPMPDLSLTRNEINNLLAYIGSLRK